ncbi:GNAT family N-acetyltransferase [[Enterobacter] lignolyticus]|uniref:GCN5 family acetyltransferase n=1 Tax=[Enterobacter] lignolyticus TaxID=1334193 RepID=A0A806XDE7_9ENTR|nr:GNAT family N-acetyltransferase [[Enterobacter] lignolyticus]ALR76761.1 GCN5 family acetyltransferase [[Enterobacter] lignolyticus]
MTTSHSLLLLSGAEIRDRLDPLVAVLADCVNGGASVSFMLPFHPDTARAFWRDVADSVDAGERLLLVAEDGDGLISGAVQLITAMPENQPHRGEVAKLLVHSRGRRQGTARALMAALEQLAREREKSVLVLDTATGSGAEIFYQRCGWQKVGEIPRFALMPDGEMSATSVFYKLL